MAVTSVVFEWHRVAIMAGINRVRRLRRAEVPRQSPIHAPRCLPAQKVEAAVGCKVMNSLGMPISRKIA